MKSPLPDKNRMKELLRFLPRLYKDGFRPIKKWGGGEEAKGVITMPWPEYENDVDEFIRVASKDCWCDYQYSPEDASKMMENLTAIESASLDEIKTMLTFCVRGEKFCDGHIGAMIKSGKIKSILNRLEVVSNENV